MSRRFEYGTTRIKDLVVKVPDNNIPPKTRPDVLLNDEPVQTTDRFWNSLHLRFGFTSNIFRYFTHEEVFKRISKVAPQDRIRWCLERGDDGVPRLLGVTNPQAALMPHDDLLALLDRYETKGMAYSNGVVSSQHSPRIDVPFQVAGDGFQNRFILDTPIDGFGKPSVFLSLLRLVCSNGAIAFTPVFRSELSVGRGDDGVSFSLQRVLDGFNNEEGFAALRQRFESSAKSWASVNEVRKLYRTLTQLHNRGEVRRRKKVVLGGDGASEMDGSPLFQSFHEMTGDLTKIYGLANLDTLSVKRQRTLPAACKVYDLLNFTSEVGTHHATTTGNRTMQAYLGDPDQRRIRPGGHVRSVQRLARFLCRQRGDRVDDGVAELTECHLRLSATR